MLVKLFLSPDIREQIRHIEKAVSTKEPRFMSRVMRSLVNTRRKLSPRILRRLITGYLTVPEAAQRKEDLLQFLTEVLTTVYNILHIQVTRGEFYYLYTTVCLCVYVIMNMNELNEALTIT